MIGFGIVIFLTILGGFARYLETSDPDWDPKTAKSNQPDQQLL